MARDAAGTAADAGLRYDPLGRLHEVSAAPGVRRFLYDGDDLLAEYSPAGAMLRRRYVHGDGAGDDPLVWIEGASTGPGAWRHLYADERGRVIAVGPGPVDRAPPQRGPGRACGLAGD